MSTLRTPAKDKSSRAVRLEYIRSEVAHANNTFWPSVDSWVQGYAEDCAWLLAELELVESALHDLKMERGLPPTLEKRVERLEKWAEDASRWSDGVVTALEATP